MGHMVSESICDSHKKNNTIRKAKCRGKSWMDAEGNEWIWLYNKSNHAFYEVKAQKFVLPGDGGEFNIAQYKI